MKFSYVANLVTLVTPSSNCETTPENLAAYYIVGKQKNPILRPAKLRGLRRSYFAVAKVFRPPSSPCNAHKPLLKSTTNTHRPTMSPSSVTRNTRRNTWIQ